MSEKFVKNVFDYVQLGEVVKAQVLEIDEENRKMKLTIKNLDYRIEDQRKLENKNGFSPLRECLPRWIKEYKERNYQK